MDDRIGSVQESADMSISNDDDCIEQQKKSNVELEEDIGEAQANVSNHDSWSTIWSNSGIFVFVSLFVISSSTSNSAYAFFWCRSHLTLALAT
jgi:hypothetical protein